MAITAAAGGGNWTSGGTWVGGIAPTAADDAQLTVTSGAVTIDSGAVCRSLDCTGYTNTLTHTAAITLTIGDATAGASNIALKLVAGMTYTLGNAATSAITFVSTSATQQTIAFGGKTVGNLTFSGAGSDYAITSNLALGATATLTLTTGTLHWDGVADNSGLSHSLGFFTCTGSSTRLANLGAANITITAASTALGWNVQGTNATITAGTSTISFGTTTFLAGASATYYNLVCTNAVALTSFSTQISSTGTKPVCNNFTYSGGAAKTLGIYFVGGITVNGVLTLAGNSATNRLLIAGATTVGTSATITCNGTNTISNADFRDITGAGSASWNLSAITGNSGDCGGNSGITFTTAATQTATGTASFSWSTHGWTTRVPLPQDDVVINNAFVAGRTVTLDMPRLGKSIDFSGCSGSPAWNNTVAVTIYGSLNLTGVTSITSSSSVVFEGRGSHTLTMAGLAIPATVVFQAFGGTYTQQDAFSTTTTDTNITAGTYDANGFNFTTRSILSTGTLTRVINMGSGTWTATRSIAGSAVLFSGSGLTINPSTSTIALTDTGSADKTLFFLSKTYNNITITGGGTGKYTFSDGGNTFNAFTVSTGPKSIRFLAGSTTTVSSLSLTGTSGNLINLDTDTGASTFTISCASSYVSCNWLNLTRSVATGGAVFFAGGSSTNGGSNTGWQFGDSSVAVTTVATVTSAATVSHNAVSTVSCVATITSAGLVTRNASSTITTNSSLVSALSDAGPVYQYTQLITVPAQTEYFYNFLLPIKTIISPSHNLYDDARIRVYDADGIRLPTDIVHYSRYLGELWIYVQTDLSNTAPTLLYLNYE